MNSQSRRPVSVDKIGNRIKARISELSPSLARVLKFIDANRLDIMNKSAVELGAMIGTSDATVIRAVQALGFDGLKDLKRELASSFGHGDCAASKMARTFKEIADDQDAAIDLVLQDHRASFDALGSGETRAQMSAAASQLASVRRVGVYGFGSSVHLARYFALQLSRSGKPAYVFDGDGNGLPDQLLNMKDVDAVVMLAYGYPHKETLACIAEARRLRKRIILITDSEKGLVSDATVVVTVQQGRPGHVTLQGATFVCLEAIVLAIASHHKERSIATLEQLNELRKLVDRSS